MTRVERNTKQTIADEVYYYLFHEISSLRLLPGTKLSEAGISRQFSCSRVPVREAVQRLVSVGALEVVPQKGSFVTKIDLKKMEENRYIREVLESRVILDGFDAGQLTGILPILSSITERQRAAYEFGDYEQIFTLDGEFHRMFYTITEKEFVLDYSGEDNIHYARARLLTLQMELKSALVEQHFRIIEAIRQGEREALRKALREHFRNVTEVLEGEVLRQEAYRRYFNVGEACI